MGENLAPRRVPVQGHPPVEHEVDGPDGLPLGDQLGSPRHDQARAVSEDPLNARQELHDHLSLVSVKPLQEGSLNREGRGVGDEESDLALRVSASAQVAHHRRVRLACQQRQRPRGLQHRGQGARLHAPGEVPVLGRVRDDHPLHATQRRDRTGSVDQRVNVVHLGGDQTHENVVAHPQARAVVREVGHALHPVQAEPGEGVRQVSGHRSGYRPRIVADDQQVDGVPPPVSAATHVRAGQHRGVARHGAARPPAGQPRPGPVRSVRADHRLVTWHVTSPRSHPT